MYRSTFFTLLAAFVISWNAHSAEASQLWGIKFGGPPTDLVSIDEETGNSTFESSIRLFGSGLAYDGNRNVLYASDVGSDVIVQFDPSEPDQLTEVASGLNFGSLAYDPRGDRLFVGVNSQQDRSIHMIEMATLEVTDLGDPGLGTIYALGWNTTNDRLYAITPGVDGFSGDGDIIRFDHNLDLSQQTLVGELHTQDIRLVRAMTYDPIGDRFYGSASNVPFRSLIEIDPYTGVASAIGPFNLDGGALRGLALVPVPEPSSLTMLALSCGMLVVGLRRRNHGTPRFRRA